MTALAAAVARRPRWDFDDLANAAHLSTGSSPNEQSHPTAPWAIVHAASGRWAWAAFPGSLDKPSLDHGNLPTPDAALDAAERAVDAAVA